MNIFKNKNSTILSAFNRSKNWIENNTVDGGIIHSSSISKPYPEVTGYYIPTLLKWGERERALQYGNWLLSIQTPEGAWQETELKTIYTFDTGQILKGLYELVDFDPKYEESFIKGCDWLVKQIDSDGRIHTPTTSHFSSFGSEYIHLYALEPLKLAAEKYQRADYVNAVARATQYYLDKVDLTEFNILSHFHAYIVEALIDLGHTNKALTALNDLKTYQRHNGAIPAFAHVRWTCLTALFQYAVCYYKLGLLKEGDKLFNYALSKQNSSGGFFGGHGWFVTYFKKIEISWAVKYFLDALHLKLKLEFSVKQRAENFLSSIDYNDERYKHLISIIDQVSANNLISSSLLDVGTGKGRFIHPLINLYPQLKITAMDISDTLFSHLPNQCNKVVGNICKIPLDDNQFDIVFCCETLEHAVNIEGAIKELSRVCKPNGYVIIIDKDLDRPLNMKLENWEQWFDKEALKNLMTESNLDVVIKILNTTDGAPICLWTGKKKNF